jgi:tRNA (guanine26-N2/guanine27-N2)-dimethyltransferase
MLTLALEEDLTLQAHSTSNAAASTNGAEQAVPDSKIIPRLPPDVLDSSPFFVMPTQMAKVIHCNTPSEDMMRGAIRSLGYRVTRSHCKGGSIKTNAPFNVLWEIVREYMRTKAPIKEGAVKAGTPGWTILSRLRDSERSHVSELKDSVKKQLVRCDTKEDLKTVLQGMLWRLDNSAIEPGKEPEQSNGAGTVNVNGGGQEARSRSESPSPVVTSKLNIVFDENLGKEKPRGKLVRYQVNPRENWGPMNRAGGNH